MAPDGQAHILKQVLGFFVVTSRNVEFLNLSSLHAFYQARLVRGYLGAANGKRLGKTSAELGWILEDNKATNNIIRSVGGVHYKTHRIYEKALVN